MRKIPLSRKNKHNYIKVPNKVIFKRHNKGIIKGFTFHQVKSTIRYGIYGLKILKPVQLKQKHVDAFRTIITRKKLLRKKQHKIWVRGLLSIPVTRKPNEIRMGKGKGSVHHWMMRLKPGKILVELSNMSLISVRQVFRSVESALGVPCQIIRLKRNCSNWRYFNRNK